MRMRAALVAASLALGAAGGAKAQSKLLISGLIDIGVYRDTLGTLNLGSIQRSNIAFSGTEDLGGGLAATFMLNHRFDPDTGRDEGVGKPFFHGESTVGLKGSFGSIRLGRALDAMNSQDWQFDAWGNYDRIASPAWDIWHFNYPSDPRGNAGNTPDFGRLNNGVFYDSPSLFGGFTVHLSTAANEDVRGLGGPEQEAQPWGVSLNYNAANWAAMLARERNSRGDTDTFVGLRGSLGDFTLFGAWDRSETFAGAVAKVFTLSGQYNLGLVTLRAGWGQLELDGLRAQRTLGAGVAYAFSRRTSVYVDAAKKRFPTDTSGMYGVGLAHSF